MRLSDARLGKPSPGINSGRPVDTTVGTAVGKSLVIARPIAREKKVYKAESLTMNLAIVRAIRSSV